jgi:hypothetical protein
MSASSGRLLAALLNLANENPDDHDTFVRATLLMVAKPGCVSWVPIFRALHDLAVETQAVEVTRQAEAHANGETATDVHWIDPDGTEP